jgi:hypothetical protein
MPARAAAGADKPERGGAKPIIRRLPFAPAAFLTDRPLPPIFNLGVRDRLPLHV